MPKAILDQSTLPRVHIPISDQLVLTVSEPCACSWYPAPSLRVTRKSIGSLGNLYPNFHFWLKSRLWCSPGQNHTWLTHFPGDDIDRTIFLFCLHAWSGTKNFLGSIPGRARITELSKQLSQTSYIYISVYRVGHT